MSSSNHRDDGHSLDGVVLKAQDVISQLGTAIAIPDLCLDEGSCTLSIDGLVVTLELDAPRNRLITYCFIAELDDSDGGRRYRSLLQGNLEGIVAGTGVVFAVDTANRVLMAESLLLDGLYGADLAADLSNFVTHAEAWRSHLEASAEQPASTIPPLLTPTTLA